MILGFWRPSRIVVRVEFAVPGAPELQPPRSSEVHAQGTSYKLRVYNLPGQDRLLAYARHMYELGRAERKLRTASAEQIDKDIREALIESAISLYISCFNSDITRIPANKLFRNKPTLKALHNLIDSLRNKVVAHGDLTYHTGHVAVGLGHDSRIEYIDMFYGTVGEWMNTRDISKFFILIRYARKWVRQKLDEERARVNKLYVGTVPHESWYVGRISVADTYAMLSSLRQTSLLLLYEEAGLDDSDRDIQVIKEPGRPAAEPDCVESYSLHRYDSGPAVSIEWSAAPQQLQSPENRSVEAR